MVQKVFWTQGAKVSEKSVFAPPKTAFATVQNGVAPARGFVLPGPKDPFAPPPLSTFGKFSLFGQFPRPAASQTRTTNCQGQLLAVWILAAKLPIADLKVAVGAGVVEFLLLILADVSDIFYFFFFFGDGEREEESEAKRGRTFSWK